VRTTLTVDDDVLRAVSERAKREQRTVGEVLSDLARQALTGQYEAQAPRESFHGFEPFSHRGPAVSNDLIDQLRAGEVALVAPCGRFATFDRLVPLTWFLRWFNASVESNCCQSFPRRKRRRTDTAARCYQVIRDTVKVPPGMLVSRWSLPPA
jgi:hypothetical protein